MTSIWSLPGELLVMICDYLDAQAIAALSATCRAGQIVLNRDVLRNLIRHRFGDVLRRDISPSCQLYQELISVLDEPYLLPMLVPNPMEVHFRAIMQHCHLTSNLREKIRCWSIKWNQLAIYAQIVSPGEFSYDLNKICKRERYDFLAYHLHQITREDLCRIIPITSRKFIEHFFVCTGSAAAPIVTTASGTVLPNRWDDARYGFGNMRTIEHAELYIKYFGSKYLNDLLTGALQDSKTPTEVVEYLLDQGAQPRSVWPGWVARKGSLSLWQRLIVPVIDGLKFYDRDLVEACVGDNVDIVRDILSRSDQFDKRFSFNPVFPLVSPEILGLLVEHRITPNFKLPSKLTVAHVSRIPINSVHEITIEEMVLKVTLLGYAAQKSDVATLKRIVELGGEVVTSAETVQPLTVACLCHNLPAVEYLLDHGADINRHDSSTHVYLEYMGDYYGDYREYQPPDYPELPEGWETLLDHFDYACMDSYPLLKLLLSRGADPTMFFLDSQYTEYDFHSLRLLGRYRLLNGQP